MLPLLLTLSALAAPPVATAVGPEGYALLVGSNRPGPGQAPLRWTGADVDRVAAVLTELGGLPADRVARLQDPDPAALLAALDELEAHLRERTAAGAEPAVVFYYSGHARQGSLDLHGETLPIERLRERLESLPASVRLVVLDACQTGEGGTAKGVEAAAAFSSASVAGLGAGGTAVLASSSGAELSQESSSLQGSFFTHHLVAGLRGAADGDHDGVVTLEEAYRYAYDRTLASTAATAIGLQHPTLETELSGRGALALTRPGQAPAALLFGEGDHGSVLLARAAGGAVVAEVDKAPGDRLRLALPAGDYTVWWRQGERTRRCSLLLTADAEAPFAPRRCEELRPERARAKGEDDRLERYALELSTAAFRGVEDAYTGTLDDFGFGEEGLAGPHPATLRALWTPLRPLSVVATAGGLQRATWRRETTGPDEVEHSATFEWRSGRAELGLRGQLPLWGGRIVPALELGGGLGWARTEWLDSEAGAEPVRELHLGGALSGGGALSVMPTFGRRDWRHLGLVIGLERVSAPVLDNLVDETHDVGGTLATLGLRGAL